MPAIASIAGRVINDSRGQQTVEVTVTDDQGRLATASLPGGSSVGKYEPFASDAQSAVTTINSVIAPALLRQPLDSQQSLDERLQKFDPTPRREKIGVNSLLGISVAGARLLAQTQGLPLYKYIQSLCENPPLTPPTPVFNLINGGKHADNNLDFQEFIVIPFSMPTFHEKLLAGRKIFAALGQLLSDAGHDVAIGYEGGYAPNLTTNEEGLGFLMQAIKASGYVAGSDVFLGLDIAASALPATYVPSVENFTALLEDFPIYWLEDPFDEDDWDSWSKMKTKIDEFINAGHPKLLVGDDLFVSNSERLTEGIKRYVANAILIKINQASTLSEVLESIKISQKYNYFHAISNRSGETLDSFIADLTYGTGAMFIKSGAPNDQAPERIVKYERIAEIEEELGVVRS